MEINLSPEDINSGIRRGLMLLDSDLSVPVSWNEELVALKFFLRALASGAYKVEPNVQDDESGSDDSEKIPAMPPNIMPPPTVPQSS